jgi:hypothetical protein
MDLRVLRIPRQSVPATHPAIKGIFLFITLRRIGTGIFVMMMVVTAAAA